MSKEILVVVDAVSNEKGVEKDIIFEAIEAALASATRRRHGEEIGYQPCRFPCGKLISGHGCT